MMAPEYPTPIMLALDTLETLRLAVRLMRERASGATPAPWTCYGDPVKEWSTGADLGVAGAQGEAPTIVLYEGQVLTGDAEHIASWHPAVALAVADWLESTEKSHQRRAGDDCGQGWTGNEYGYVDPSCSSCGTPDEYAEPWPCHPFNQALVVARAYLGETS